MEPCEPSFGAPRADPVGERCGRGHAAPPRRGATVVAEDAVVGPDTTLRDVEVGRGAKVVRTHGELAVIGAGAEVGPFSYLRPGAQIGAGGKVGAMIEIQCETDFVARNEEFREFAREVAIHVAGSPTPPRYVSAEEIPESERDAERRVHEAKAKEEGKPAQAMPKIVEGRVNAFFKDVVLLDQPSVTDPKTTVGKQLDAAGVKVLRFARFDAAGA